MYMGETDDVDKQRMEKKKAAVVAITTVATTLSVAVSHIRKTRRRVQPYIHRASMPHPLRSDQTTQWKELVSCGSSSDFVKLLNFDRHCFFDILLPRFESVRSTVNFGSPFRKGPKKRGRNPHVTSLDILGLVLKYVKSTGRQYEMCGMFGFVPSTVSVWIDYGLTVLLKVLRDKSVPEFRVKWPKIEEMDESHRLLKFNRSNGPLLPNVFAVIDGARMPCADYTDSDLQNAFYEGYTGNTEITNIFVFNFKGELIHAAVNFPGSWHDSKVVLSSGLLLDRLSDDKTPRGYAILGDSAFIARARVTHGKILRGRKASETHDVPESALLAAVDAVLQRAMPSERQSAEWGVRAVKAPFGRLRLPLSADASIRFRLLQVSMHLYNLRTRKVGLNQIRTVYGDEDISQQPWTDRLAEE